MANPSDNYRKPSPIWKLSESLSIVEATLLILEIEPQGHSDTVEDLADSFKPDGYLATKKALVSSVRREALGGWISPILVETEGGGYEEDFHRVDYHASHVDVSDLRRWLAERGYSCSTFSTHGRNCTGYRDPHHPRYAIKLAAVVEAWEAFEESSDERGTPKQRLMKWLRLNAARFGLTGDDGAPMENVIEELAKVANWATSGGAPKKTSEEPTPF